MNQTPSTMNFETQATSAVTASSTPWKVTASRSRIAIISASWHTEVVYQARDAAQAELQAQGVQPGSIQHFSVPGAFEIPLMATKLAQSGRFDAVIACALIVNGGIYRHEFVTTAVIDGLMRVQLESEVPVFSAVLTPRDFHEHGDHVEFFRQHFVKKGAEVAQACLNTLDQHAKMDALFQAKAA